MSKKAQARAETEQRQGPGETAREVGAARRCRTPAHGKSWADTAWEGDLQAPLFARLLGNTPTLPQLTPVSFI